MTLGTFSSSALGLSGGNKRSFGSSTLHEETVLVSVMFEWLITMIGGHTGDGVHILFNGTDGFTAFMDSFPLKNRFWDKTRYAGDATFV